MNTIRTQSGGTLGTSKDERGIVLPEFAVPNARTGPLDKDANIAQDDCSTSENPCPSDAAALAGLRDPTSRRDPRL